MMKKWMLKRTGTWVMLVVFLFTAVMTMAGFEVEASAASDFVLTHSCTDTLNEGETFTLPLKMKNLAADDITGIELDFSDAKIASLTSGGTVYVVGGAVTVTPGEEEDIASISMRFTGDGTIDIMPVTVRYTVGAGPEETVNISLYLNAEIDDNDGGGSYDPPTDLPSLQAIVGYNAVSAGSTNKVVISLKNISSYISAKNIVYAHKYDAALPFTTSKVNSTMPITNLQYGKSVDMELSIDVDKYAKSGVHPFTFSLTYSNPWNTAEETKEFTVYLKVVNYYTNARLNVYLPEDQSVTAVSGGTFTLPLRIFNEGNLPARDVRATLTGLTQETFTLSSGTGRNEYYSIGGNETKEISYTLKASSSLKSGSYPLTVKLEYSDEKGTKTSEEQQVWIPVAGSEGKVSMLEVLEIKPSLSTVKPGESFDVSVKIKNSGDFDARQIKVSADGTASLLPVTQNLIIITSLPKGETKTINFKFQPQPDAARGGVPITIKVESVDGGSQETAISQAISVFVDSTSDGTDDAGKNVPKIIVKSYSSEPTLVKAGEKFTLNMQFLNTHSAKTVRNIKGNFIVTESSNETGNVFTPVDCSNTFYIDEIAPKETCDWTMTLYTIPDALSKTYTVNISFEYEDDAGNPYKGDELIGIPVYQPSRFETSEISMPPEAFMGQPQYVAFEMYNMGKTDIYNVRLTVEGDFEAQPKSNYFGNFESGRREYFEFNLVPMMVGEGKGQIVFQYENASGELQEYVKEFSMNVMEMMMPPEGEMPVDGKPMPGMEEPKPPQGFIGSVWFFVIIGVVVVGVIVTIVLIRRKRKKDKELDF